MQRLLGIAQGEHADDEKERFHRRSCHGRPRCHPIIGPHPARMSRPEKYHPTDMELPRIRAGSALPASAAVLVSTHILWGKTSIPSPGRAVPPGRRAGGATTARFSDRRGQTLRYPTRRPDHGRARGCSSSSRPLGPTSGRCVTRIRREVEPVAESNLVLHRGAREVSQEELQRYQAPPPEGRWFPLATASPGGRRPDADRGGLRIVKQQLGVMRDGSRFFATLDLASPVAEGVSLAVGIRNSVDKCFPLGFCAVAGLLLRQPGVSLRIARQAEAHHPRRAATSPSASSRRSARSTRSRSRRRPGPSGSGDGTRRGPGRRPDAPLFRAEHHRRAGAAAGAPAVAEPAVRGVPAEDGLEPPECVYGGDEGAGPVAAARLRRPVDEAPRPARPV